MLFRSVLFQVRANDSSGHDPTEDAETPMTFLKKLLGRNEPATRVHVCQECGMPVADHKDWCSILAGQRALEQGQAPATE